MSRAVYYTARNGLVWTICGGNVRTVTEAEGALADLGRMAVEVAHPEPYLAQLCDLVCAIREAKEQERAVPVMEAA